MSRFLTVLSMLGALLVTQLAFSDYSAVLKARKLSEDLEDTQATISPDRMAKIDAVLDILNEYVNGGAVGYPGSPNAELECFSHVQGRIAWDYTGQTQWVPTNVQNLCRGTRVATEPGRCFHRAMHEGGRGIGIGGMPWQWGPALELCQGTNNANRTIRCFIRTFNMNGRDLLGAVRACRGQ